MFSINLKNIILTIAFFSFFSINIYTQQRQEIKGTTVSIIPPDGFVVSADFNGFINVNASATIIAMEIPTKPYVYLDEAIIKTDLESQGASIISREKVKTNNGDSALLYLLHFTASNYPLERVVLLTGDYNKSYFLMANYPRSIHDLIYSYIKDCMLTIQFKK